MGFTKGFIKGFIKRFWVGAVVAVCLVAFFIPIHGSNVQAGTELTVTGTLSQAQILVMDSVPVIVAPAGGAGTMIVIDSMIIASVPTATAYGDGSFIIGSLGTSSFKQFTYEPTNSFIAGAIKGCSPEFLTDITLGVCLQQGAVNSTRSSMTNLPLTITADGAGFTCADVCGTLNYQINYRILRGF